MSTSNLTELNERLLSKPEPLREDLARYINEHLEELEAEMHWAEDPTYLSPELRAELTERENDALANPRNGISWEELENRLHRPR